MYYSRGGDSLNVSCRGEGDAVLVKSARVFIDEMSPEENLRIMHRLNPIRGGERPRARLCSGQTLLCRALSLSVREWNAKSFDPERFYIDDVGYLPKRWVRARRLGIPAGRDEHLLWRFIDSAHLASATENPLSKRGAKEGVDYFVIS
jgi:DNA-3-methyladenine glycosylase